MVALFLLLFIWIPLAISVTRVLGLPMLVVAMLWLGFVILFAPINYFFGPFIIIGP
jgi:hypothetical protein